MIQVYPKVVEDALKWQGLVLKGISAERIPPALVTAGILDPDKEWHYGGRTPPGTYVMLELNEVYSNLLALQSWEYTIADWTKPADEFDPQNPPSYSPPPTIDNTLPAPGFGIDNSLPTPPAKPDQSLPEAPNKPDQGLPGTPAKPDHGLPGTPSKPDQGLPSTPSKPDNTLPSTDKPDNTLPESGAKPKK